MISGAACNLPLREEAKRRVVVALLLTLKTLIGFPPHTFRLGREGVQPVRRYNRFEAWKP
jgi:hypothetical protein